VVSGVPDVFTRVGEGIDVGCSVVVVSGAPVDSVAGVQRHRQFDAQALSSLLTQPLFQLEMSSAQDPEPESVGSEISSKQTCQPAFETLLSEVQVKTSPVFSVDGTALSD